MSTNPYVDEFKRNMQYSRFKSTVFQMYMGLLGFGMPDEFSPDERNLMCGVILQNWDKSDDQIAVCLKEAGVGLEGGMSSPNERVRKMKKHCQKWYDEIYRKRWWQFWK